MQMHAPLMGGNVNSNTRSYPTGAGAAEEKHLHAEPLNL